MSEAASPTPSSSRNRLRALVCGLVWAQAAALLAGAAFLLFEAVTSTQEHPAGLVGLAAVAALFGAGLAVCALGVGRGQAWTRGPVLTWQLVQAFIGMPLSTSRIWWLGVPLLAVSVLVGLLIAGPHVVPRSSRRF